MLQSLLAPAVMPALGFLELGVLPGNENYMPFPKSNYSSRRLGMDNSRMDIPRGHSVSTERSKLLCANTAVRYRLTCDGGTLTARSNLV
jgi:hypothetical protein